VIRLDGRTLTPEAVERVAYGGEKVTLAPEAIARMNRSRRVVERILSKGETVYGITTGFGVLKDVKIKPDETRELQRNLVRSHAAGVGDLVQEEVSRAAVLLRANALATGHSGVRPVIVTRLLNLLNQCQVPVVPAQGSRWC